MKTTIFSVVFTMLISANLFAVASNIDIIIREKVNSSYPNAVITEIENEGGIVEVEIIHEQKKKDLRFSSSGVWQSTKYDIDKSQLPENIEAVIESNGNLSGYKVDEVSVIETPDKSIYEIELDKWFADDITVFITFDGVII